MGASLARRVVFYDNGTSSLGIQYLIAALKQEGHDVQMYFDSSLSRDHLASDLIGRQLGFSAISVARDLLALRPDVVCFSSSYTFSYQMILELIKVYRTVDGEAAIVCGGPHVTLVPDVVLENPEVDFAVVGEGEQSLSALVAALAKARSKDEVKGCPPDSLPGVWSVHNGRIIDRGLSPLTRDLDLLPFPDKTLYAPINPTFGWLYTITASRGCVCSCTYCNSPSMNQIYSARGESHWRVRSVDNVIEELRLAVKLYGPRYVVFHDDIFGLKLPWLREFCSKYKEHVGLPYGVQTHPTLVSEERLQLLADSGCVALELGLQSTVAEVRREILDRNENNQDVRAAIRQAKELGVLLELDMIVNLPGEIPQHREEMLDFIRETRPEVVNMSFLQFFPKTPIVETGIRQGMIRPEDVYQLERGRGVNMNRLMSHANLEPSLRVMPVRAYAAAHLPGWIEQPLSRMLKAPGTGRIVSLFASQLLYGALLWISLTDARSFWQYTQIRRMLYAVRLILRKKIRVLFCGTPRSGCQT